MATSWSSSGSVGTRVKRLLDCRQPTPISISIGAQIETCPPVSLTTGPSPCARPVPWPLEAQARKTEQDYEAGSSGIAQARQESIFRWGGITIHVRALIGLGGSGGWLGPGEAYRSVALRTGARLRSDRRRFSLFTNPGESAFRVAPRMSRAREEHGSLRCRQVAAPRASHPGRSMHFAQHQLWIAVDESVALRRRPVRRLRNRGSRVRRCSSCRERRVARVEYDRAVRR